MSYVMYFSHLFMTLGHRNIQGDLKDVQQANDFEKFQVSILSLMGVNLDENLPLGLTIVTNEIDKEMTKFVMSAFPSLLQLLSNTLNGFIIYIWTLLLKFIT